MKNIESDAQSVTPAFSGDMTNLFPVSKTLAFRLLPVGRTREYIEKAGVITQARQLQDDYSLLKEAADRVHKRFIEEILSKLHLKYLSDGGMDSIQEYADLFDAGGVSADIAAVAIRLKESVTKAFEEARYNDKKSYLAALQSELLVKEILAGEDLSDEERAALHRMRDYTTYMRPYFTIRARMYRADEEGSTIPSRIVDDNLPVHLRNRNIFEKLPAEVVEKAAPVFAETAPVIPWAYELADVFTVSAAACLSAQSAIDAYNTLIGGIGLLDGGRIQGLNELINLYNQAHAGEEGYRKLPQLKRLSKQILSDRSTPSWIPDAFDDDVQVTEGLEALHAALLGEAALPSPEEAFIAACNADTGGVLVSARRLSALSLVCTGSWSEAERCLKEQMREENPIKRREKQNNYNERINREFKKRQYFTYEEIGSAVVRFGPDGTGFPGLDTYISKAYASPYMDAAAHYEDMTAYIASMKEGEPLGQPEGDGRDSARGYIRDWLDDLMDAKRGVEVFSAGSGAEQTDTDFYEKIVQPVAAFADLLVPFYNKVRNYLTKKPFSSDKMRLFFDTPTLLGGWDRNKEEDNRGVLIRDGRDKYLAIIPRHSKKVFSDSRAYEDGSEMQRLVLKYIPGPFRMLPKVGFSSKAAAFYQPSEEVLAIKNGPKKTADYDPAEVAVMVDYYKHVLATNPEWADMEFTLKESSAYTRLNEFFDDVDRQGYRLTWKGLSRAYIDMAVERGDLYLFKITCQDMSAAHHGMDGNFKAILDEAFSDRNAADTKVRISGGAAIYYREPSLPEAVTHPAGIPIANKNPDNPRRARILPYGLTKDRRFTREHFALHIPVLLQPDADKRGNYNVNEAVRQMIKDEPGMYVVGINRGEHNLVSVAVTAPDGRIVEQRHLNVFDGFDYRRKLAERESERTQARKDWNEVEDIRKLKAGYLSRVIGEIVRLVKKYNCVVALEQLDSEFKRGRQQFEKNVYQQFERDLVGRLSFLMDKHDPDRTRSVLQLTSPGDSIEERTKYPQNGIVFFMSPSWITKTDPLTGFANALDTHYESVAKAEKLLSRYDSFRYVPERDLFALSFSYSRTNPEKETGDGRTWTIYTNGVRTDVGQEEGGLGVHILTKEMKQLLDGEGIAYENGGEILPALIGRGAEFYKEFYRILRLTLRNNNWNDKEKEYRLVGCTCDAGGRFFDSAIAPERLPKDPDINAAWNIARKCQMVLRNIRNYARGVTMDPEGKTSKGPRLTVSDAEWFIEAQK